jgi:putative transposase
MSPADRRARVERDDPVLPIVAQCRLLKIARSTLYYRAAPVDPDDLAVMRRMDELYLASPFYTDHAEWLRCCGARVWLSTANGCGG